MSDKQTRIKWRLYEVSNAICHWRTQKDKAEYYLAERLKEKAKLEKEVEECLSQQ